MRVVLVGAAIAAMDLPSEREEIAHEGVEAKAVERAVFTFLICPQALNGYEIRNVVAGDSTYVEVHPHGTVIRGATALGVANSDQWPWIDVSPETRQI